MGDACDELVDIDEREYAALDAVRMGGFYDVNALARPESLGLVMRTKHGYAITMLGRHVHNHEWEKRHG